jgi:hypothetical protein
MTNPSITIIVSPEPRNPAHPPQRARFVTAVECPERALGAFPNPLCSAARVLLSEGVQPETVLPSASAEVSTRKITACARNCAPGCQVGMFVLTNSTEPPAAAPSAGAPAPDVALAN